MLDTSALVVGVTGAVLLAGSLVPAAIDSRPQTASAVVASSGEGWRAPPASDRLPVPATEVAGSNGTAIVLGGPNGAMLFHAEPMTSTSWIARNVERPMVTARRAPVAPVVQPPPARAADDPAARKSPKTRMVGCEGALSPLVKQQVKAVPGLCLT